MSVATLPDYQHLMPLFTRRHRLPPDHPAQEELRTELITGHLPLARRLARRHRHRGENSEDLEQVATVGLIYAVDRFDLDRGHDFVGFAIPTIDGELHRHCRDRAATIRVPRRARALQGELVRAVHELGQRNGTTPRPGDIGRYLGLDLDGVAEAMEAYHRSYCVSLDEPSTTEAGSEVLRFVNVLCTADHDLEMVVERESLGPLIEALPEREQRIVLLRFFGNRTQSQIAAEMSLSQMHVSRLLTATLAALRADLDRVPGGDR